MKLLIVLCAVVAVSQAGIIAGGIAGLTAPGVLGVPGVLGAPGVLGVPGIIGAPGVLGVPGVLGAHGVLGVPGVLGAPGVIAAPGLIAARAVVPAAASPLSTLAPGGPAGLALTAAGTPVETVAVQAARVADAVAHVNAKTILG